MTNASLLRFDPAHVRPELTVRFGDDLLSLVIGRTADVHGDLSIEALSSLPGSLMLPGRTFTIYHDRHLIIPFTVGVDGVAAVTVSTLSRSHRLAQLRVVIEDGFVVAPEDL